MSTGVIIRLQNLPWSANSFDIRQFFKGLSIPEGGVHIVGGELGDAFIAFSSDEDARQAMMLSGGKLKEVQVSLLLSSRSEMQKVIEKARTIKESNTQPVVMPIQPKQEEIKSHKRSRSRSRSRSKRRDDRGRRRSRSRSRDRNRRRSRTRSRGRYNKDNETRDLFRKAEEASKSDQGRNGNLGGLIGNHALENNFPLLANPFGFLGGTAGAIPYIDDRLVRTTLSALGGLAQADKTALAATLSRPDQSAAARFVADGRGPDVTTPIFATMASELNNAGSLNSKLGPAFIKSPSHDPSQVWLTPQLPIANLIPPVAMPFAAANTFQENKINVNNNFRPRGSEPRERHFRDNDNDRRIVRDTSPNLSRVLRNENPRGRIPDNFNGPARNIDYRDDQRLQKNNIGLCVELEGCPPISFKAIERAFAKHDVVVDDVRFSGKGRGRRVGVKVMGRMSKSSALQLSERLTVGDAKVKIYDLPEQEYFAFQSFRDPAFENNDGRRRSGDGPRAPMRRRYDEEYFENGNDFPRNENFRRNEDPSNVDCIKSDCVFVSNLPPTTCDRDLVDFFSDIGLTPKKIHLMYDNDRQPLGQAYVEFWMLEQAAQACEKNGAPMGRFTVSVTLAPRREMNNAMNFSTDDESQKQPLIKLAPVPLMEQRPLAVRMPIYPLLRTPEPRHRGFGQRPLGGGLPDLPPVPDPDRVVTMSNIPYRATTDDILSFFGPSYNICPDDVFRKVNDRNQPTSDARIVMRNSEDASCAVNTLNHARIWDRPVTLQLLKHAMD